jgi:aspartate carbamoyltransferase catalytic subunit
MSKLAAQMKFRLMDFQDWDAKNLESFFSQVQQLKTVSKNSQKNLKAQDSKKLSAALLFFEASTRTRVSFEFACHRAGVSPVLFSAGAGTSLDKGETLEDSFLNLAACRPDLLIVRAQESFPMEKLCQASGLPWISAGWGSYGHPTQALLDVFSISERKALTTVKMLFVGDIKHSRVVRSNVQLLKILGVPMAVCGPASLVQNDLGLPVIEKLSEALDWANVVMALRYQFERFADLSPDELRDQISPFALTQASLSGWSTEGLILHPGPVNKGVEMSEAVYVDPRSIILNQVENGVFVREALIRQALHHPTEDHSQ